ncbi:hypothetical protein KOW79_015541 [Hemibagrus wyckioides]|uniref:Uncharacterized protein n=1 Tax=Hemibagrus wyckioides TaxID=337641 RepID=A0A9D3SE77_9TELE|nr:hypothetical protein KOW79_015541 [Hemibagrus wyckioides]
MGNTTSRSNSQTDPEKTSLLSKEENGITYRIPALIYINDTQTFLAFAEKRTSPSDTDATLLVMRRGTRQNGLIQWSDVQELDTACLPGHRTMNPCPVYDKKFKALFLFFICVEVSLAAFLTDLLTTWNKEKWETHQEATHQKLLCSVKRKTV